jgi:hypothetical protein
VTIEEQWTRDSTGGLVSTGRARIVVDAEIRSHVAAEIHARLTALLREAVDVAPGVPDCVAGAGI